MLDFDTYNNFIITLGNGSNTLAEPTTEGSQVGKTGYIIFIQPSSGTASVSLHGDYETVGGTGITLSSTNGQYDALGYIVKGQFCTTWYSTVEFWIGYNAVFYRTIIIWCSSRSDRLGF